MFEKKFDFTQSSKATGIYACARCGNGLFDADKKFEAGCGFPSFYMHKGKGVSQNPLHTYGRTRIQLLCSHCGLHLGHLFENRQTPSGLRYCINEDAIRFTEE